MTEALTGDMRRLVADQRLGFVATVSPDGTPNVSPIEVERALPLVSPAYAIGRSEEELAAEWRAYWRRLDAARAAASPSA